jgi:hypothetical protein
MKNLIITGLIIFLHLSLAAQQGMIMLPDGSLISKDKFISNREAERIELQNNQLKINRTSYPNLNQNDDAYSIDTLRLPGPWDVNFDFYGQDRMLQWFECPSDLILKKIGFACYENPDDWDVEVTVVKVNWSRQELLNAEVLQRGYYEAIGNGFNDITAFLDSPDRTGGWTSIQPGDTEPFGHDIWADMGLQSLFPICNDTIPTLQWIDLSLFGEPELNMGDIFGISIQHSSINMDENRMGFWAHQYEPPIPAWKFYANGHFEPGVDFGWWTSEYSFYFVAEVDLITNVDYSDEIIFDGFLLYQNYPNPFNPTTTLSFVIGHRSFVTLKVYDVLGNEIATLVDDYKPAGEYEIEFNPASGNRNLASGIYFYQLKTGNYIETKKMILIK